MRKGRIIDSHAHLVQYIAGTGAGGELRSIGKRNGCLCQWSDRKDDTEGVWRGSGDAGTSYTGNG